MPTTLISANANKKRSKSAKSSAKPKSKSAPVPPPEESGSEPEADGNSDGADEAKDDSGSEDAEEESEGELYGFSTDEDSDDDDMEVGDGEGVDIGKLPTIAKDDRSIQRRLEKAKREPTSDRGVISVSRLPHGFYEDQLKGYFSQFGNVTRLRVSRNKKTGKSKHYAFLEFDSSSVAEIVVETMDNYLLMGHILKCKYIPREKVHPELWIGANKKWKAIPRAKLARESHNKPRTDEEKDRAEKRLLKRQEERKRKLEEVGIKYEFGDAAYKKAKS
ncbi:RNA-binding domain-containing protein [Coniophora puteana RWD-64-598 SS2]|uniref:RNA-binding domain-containing protein n=1 Tax=Coniophora puteana (strain RWD-64-598) TaxID=741705 RepID=A0A5M3MZP4_CONPW|nr:RNA-binding domain-containing protein [Coniophora puteana RWD-64-598 SS2]EIW84101.1 RNA-binding domain-containing protein [Coniophora puteana RWD-64-598 SS2]